MSEVAQVSENKRAWGRKALAWLLWISAALACLLISVAVHLRLPRARIVVRELLDTWVSDAIQGEIEVVEVSRLALDRIVVHGVTIRDPEGRVVIHAEEVSLWPSWSDLLHGRVRTHGARIERGDVRLFVSEDGENVSLVDAFRPSSPSPTTGGPVSPIPILIDGIHLLELDIRGDVPGYEGLDLSLSEAQGSMLFHQSIVFRIDHLEGRMIGPHPGETLIDHGVVSFDTNSEEGLRAYVRARRGEDRVRARISMQRPSGTEETDPQHLNLEVHADHLSFATLDEIGVPLGDNLVGAVRGDVQLVGPTDDLAFTSSLEHEAGWLSMRGRLAGQEGIRVEAETHDFALHRLVPSAPEMSIGGQFRIDLTPDPTNTERARFHAEALPMETLGVALPAFTADGMITEDSVVIERIDAPHLNGTIEGNARVGFDGSIEAHARFDVGDLAGDPNVSRAVPSLHGSAHGTLDLETGPSGANLVLSTDVRLRNVRLGDLRARAFRLRGRARGSLQAPIVDAELDAEEVVVANIALGHIAATIDGGPTRYRLRWQSRGEQIRRLDIDTEIERRGESWILHTAPFVLDVGLGPMRGSTGDIRLDSDVLSLAGLRLEGQNQRLAIAGHVHLSGGSNQITADLEGFDLARLHTWLENENLGNLSGLLDAHVELEGTLRNPEFLLSGRVQDLSFDRIRDSDLIYEFRFRDGVLDTNVTGDLGTRGTLGVEGPITVPSFATLTNPDRFMREAEFGIHVYGGHLNLAFIVPLLGESVQALGISGRIGGEIRLYGTLETPRIEPSVIIFDRLALPGVSELRVKIAFDLREGQLRVAPMWIGDSIGELAMIEARLPISLESPPTGVSSFTRTLSNSPWSIALRIAPRLLETWPQPLEAQMPRGVRGALALTAVGGDGEPARGTMTGTMEWVEPPTRGAPCANALRPLVQMTGTLYHGMARIDASGFVAANRVLFARADAATPIDEWLRTGSFSIPEPDLLVQLLGLPLEHVPWICHRASGIATAELMVGGLFSAHPELDGRVQIDGLRIASGEDADLHGTTPHDMLAEVHLEESAVSSAHACAIIAREGMLTTPFDECHRAALPQDTETILRASVPLRFTPGLPLPELSTADPISIAMLMSDAHLEPLLALVPQLANADVIVDGRIEANGGIEELQFAGGLELREGRARIVPLGQQLTDIRGAIRLSGTSLIISDDKPLFARDGNGTLSIHGEIGMQGVVPSYAYLEARPNEFPVRREGAVLATISGVGDTRLNIDVDGLEGRVETSQLTVRLPEQMAGAVQSLDEHSDIVVVGSVAPELGSDRGHGYPIHLTIDAQAPFWVRRNDFEIQVTAELDARYLDPHLMIGGYARLPRGHFEVFGKRFEVQRGSLSFDGNEEIDPVIDLFAVYELPGSPGSNVSVSASGRMSTLRIEFASTETNDQGEIIALLVSGPRRIGETDPNTTQVATQQAARVVTGLAAGILTLGLRQQFGDIVPMIAIETGGNLGDTRIRAGFNADAIIPDFLRDIVRGAYVEGFVTTRAAGQSSTQGGVGAGVTIELQFPYDLVGSGTYVPPSTWGFDLLWEPL